MAYASAAEGDYGSNGSVIHADASHAKSISVPDAELLFRGEFRRAGPDLVLTGDDGRHHLIPGYFADEKHPALVAPNGASLSPDLVDLLAGSPTPANTRKRSRRRRPTPSARWRRWSATSPSCATASPSRRMSATPSTRAT